MTENTGWIAVTGLDSTTVDPEIKARIRQRHEVRGRLLGIVEVRVFEHATVPQVSFPQDALLGPDSDPATIAAAVRRARDELDRWR